MIPQLSSIFSCKTIRNFPCPSNSSHRPAIQSNYFSMLPSSQGISRYILRDAQTGTWGRSPQPSATTAKRHCCSAQACPCGPCHGLRPNIQVTQSPYLTPPSLSVLLLPGIFFPQALTWERPTFLSRATAAIFSPIVSAHSYSALFFQQGSVTDNMPTDVQTVYMHRAQGSSARRHSSQPHL